MTDLIKAVGTILIGFLVLNNNSLAETQAGSFSGSQSCPKGYYFIPPCPVGKQCAWRGNVCMKYPTSPDHWPLIRRPGSLSSATDNKTQRDSGYINNPIESKKGQNKPYTKPINGNESYDIDSPLFKGGESDSDKWRMKSCIEKEAEWGKKCGNPDSLKIVFRNQCSETVELRYCLERTNGKWDCGRVSRFKIGDETHGAWICSATGRYQWSVKDTE